TFLYGEVTERLQMSYTWVTDDNDRGIGTRKENACQPAPRNMPHAFFSARLINCHTPIGLLI
ncbi:MAG TPA: hypothetical protein VGK10_16270, partial [Prolixibacteraceae bacterium]